MALGTMQDRTDADIVGVILRRLLGGEIDPDAAIERLSPYAVIELDDNPSFITWKKVVSTEVPISASDVRIALDRYLAGEWDVRRLKRWAALVSFFDQYEPTSPPADDEDFNDDLWDVIHELGSPEVFGEISPETVQEKRQRLEKYD